MLRYADIVLPLGQPSFTFAFDSDLGLSEGDAVVVPFGRSRDKLCTGVVWRIHDERPPFANIKSVQRKLYPDTLLDKPQREFWSWIADYYICSCGEVMRVALPSMMKPTGWDHQEFAKVEYRPRQENYLALSPALCEESEERDELLEKLERRAPRQYETLLELLSAEQNLFTDDGYIAQRLLSSASANIAPLVKKGLLNQERRAITIERERGIKFNLPALSPAQSEALRLIEQQSAHTTLLHGVTGSGKTEIYIHLIAKTLARGGDVLLLVPEIALTSQLIERMERIFGSRVVAYHSKLSARRRTEIYLQLNSQIGGNFVIGVRSSLFLPLRSLELVIVDEEHDSSYKQQEPAPRYSARDCSVALASMRGIKCLLGSATPSLESWMNGQSGKYGYVTLTERYGDAKPPKIEISDVIRSAKRGERRGHFNFALLDRMEQRIESGEQIILFQNRRGFSPYVECPSCGWSARCPHCNVSLSLHKGQRRMVCHYCGYYEEQPLRCPSCHVGEPQPMGFGTEKIEEQLGALMPQVGVVRLDRDALSSEGAFRRIIESFESGEKSIMVGTQMVTKGFDFGRVTLVGVLNADNLFNNPDFRAEERAFQMLTQVAGRAGRRDDSGEVVIQTSQPKHRVLRYVAAADYESMARELLVEREQFFYPPYSRLTAITMRHADQSLLNRAANYLSQRLRELFPKRVQGPTPPPVDRVRGEYLVSIILKVEYGASSVRARKVLREVLEQMVRGEFRAVKIACDVDPQ